MFAWLRRGSDAPAVDLSRVLETLTAVLTDIREQLAEQGVATEPTQLVERIDDLERSRALWEAEIEAMLNKADSTFKQARAAEERTRHLGKKLAQATEDDADDLEDVPEEYRRAVLAAQNGDRGAQERLPELPQGVGVGRQARRAAQRALATRMKFGA